ncbi:MAG: hypothetical protein KC561_17750, partial [Myxococcales bacterium]|nr:hypothetical protein [Myxococcales bacterium]
SAPEGDAYLVLEDQPLVIRLSRAGSVEWARGFSRDPYAFGGMEVHDSASSEDGTLFLAGAFSPSEGGDERGFLMSVGADGEANWLRSWRHDFFVERQRVAVTADRVFVADQVPGSNEIDRRQVLLAFDHDGGEIAQTAAVMNSFDGPIAAFSWVAIAADGNGVRLFGTRSNARDGSFDVSLGVLAFDANLTLQSQNATRVVLDGFRAAPIHEVVALSDGSWAVLGTIGEAPALFHAVTGGPAIAYQLVGEGGEPALIDDEDYLLRGVADSEGGILLAGSAEMPGDVTLTPFDVQTTSLGVSLSDPGLEVFTDVVTGEESSDVPTASADEAGALDMPESGDEDVIILHFGL